MKPSFRQHMHKWRTLFGAIALLCLLWHILLPTMVHTGIVPALYAMPSHCQVTEIQKATLLSTQAHNSSHHQHIMQQHNHHLDHTQHGSQLSEYAQQVYALASQIMKHCPLCTYGLDAAAIVPLIAFIFVFLLAWFSRVRCLCHAWTEDLHIARLFYILPIKQAPPLAL
ncbi:hypothetical protein [Acinetobacter sp. NIPH 2699]|uniref:hypothetical protein n=1 Tax=Acinetobacter sp. NIPH 2699 TaxID=2923433 RepID=UPI001F4A58E1|nr:hypothetical protein [Acinetobacter sp. NIPH 2699]MCH7335011.1 hypothetical protein [Acinetobacter sp. NIPH 2699]